MSLVLADNHGDMGFMMLASAWALGPPGRHDVCHRLRIWYLTTWGDIMGAAASDYFVFFF